MACTIKIESGHAHIVFSGRLTLPEIAEVEKQLDKIEAKAGVSYSRFVDLTGVVDLELNFIKVNQLTASRRSVKLFNLVRAGLVAKSPVQYGIARMFQTLNVQPQTEVGVFSDPESALKWIAEISEKPAG
jgi:hypothetical protein